MASPATDNPLPLARALGRIPSGLYLVTTLAVDKPVGFVGSFLQQVGFAPPTICVAVGRDRGHLAALRTSGVFGVMVLDKGCEKLMGRFFRKYPLGSGPFDGLVISTSRSGAPLLPEALAWLDCRVSGEHDLADHVVVFGEVLAGSVQREGDPTVHLRSNGLAY
jgi:flavin reductase (DIM6/NTAB) family NADH-FMN oxidoreductase RutF